jgi:hypothetical protein
MSEKPPRVITAAILCYLGNDEAVKGFAPWREGFKACPERSEGSFSANTDPSPEAQDAQ